MATSRPATSDNLLVLQALCEFVSMWLCILLKIMIIHFRFIRTLSSWSNSEVSQNIELKPHKYYSVLHLSIQSEVYLQWQ